MQAVLHKKKTSALTVEEEKNEVAIKLLTLNNQDIVHSINVIVDDLIGSISRKNTKSKYNNEIDAAVKRVRRGKSISNDKVMDEMDRW